MSFFDGTIYSDTLEIDTRLAVVLPQDSRDSRVDAASRKHSKNTPRTLILLHGLTDNASAWWMRTSIVRYAEQYGITVFMPQAEKSFYQDMAYGDAYFSYVTQELPELCSAMFQASFAPEDLMIAGLSMGGYGALRCALTYPDRYAACGAFSSACDVKGMAHLDVTPTRGFLTTYQAIFGDSLQISDSSDIYALAEKCGDNLRHMRIYMSCGQQDNLLESNARLAGLIRCLPTRDFLYEERPGEHEWGFWDKSVESFLRFLAQ